MSLTIEFKPSYKQHLAWQKLEDPKTSVICYGGAAGGGKSYLGCIWKIQRRLKYKGTRGLIAREKRVNLVDSTLVTYRKVLNLFNLKEGIHYKMNNQRLTCEFYNGSIELFRQLPFLPSDPDFHYLGSVEYTDVFLEEASQIKEKAFEVTKSRTRWMLSEYNLIPKVLITCNPSQDWLYKEFYYPNKKGTLEADRCFIPALVTDNPDPAFVKVYLDSLNKIKDPILRGRLRDGDWDYTDDEKILFRQDNLVNLVHNTHLRINATNDKRYITADTARYGKDSTVIYVWYGLKVHERVQLEHSRDNLVNATNQTIEKIKELQDKHSVFRNNIIIDELGAGGGGVIDGLSGCTAFVGSSKPKQVNDNLFETYKNLKAQCVYKLSELISNNEIWLAIDNPELHQKIINEAKAHKKHDIDKDKLSITTKEEIKEALNGNSPDDFDNFIMRMLPEIKSTYDPYAAFY